MRGIIRGILLSASFLILCGGLARAEGPPAKPNILWIYSDDHAVKAVSAYGGPLAELAPTPNIDRLAKEGMLFRNSFVSNSLCGPARAVILTGLHSHKNGFRANSDRFDSDQRTYPKLLQKIDYQTAVFGKWHLVSDPQGFDTWAILPGQGHYYNPDFLLPGGKEQPQGYVTDIIADKALHWLREDRDTSRPFMLMVQNKAPHREWEPGPAHLNLFDDVTFPEPETLFDDYSGRGTAAHDQDMTIAKTMRMGPDLKVWPEDEKGSPEWRRTFGRMTDAQRAAWEQAYAPENAAFIDAHLEGKDLVRWKYQRYMKDYLRSIRSVDDNVGRLLDYLDASGLAENTVVFYSSDQGFYLGEHGWFDKRFIYEESLRTPLIVRWPGVVKPGSESDALVQNLDIAETMFELAGAPVPGDMQGLSLVPIMKGETPVTWRDGIYYHYYEGEKAVHHVYKHYGVRTERHKIAYFYTLDEWEFYDLEKDPQELHSVYDDPAYAEEVGNLKAELDRLRAQYEVPVDET